MHNYWICKDCLHSWDSTDRLVPMQCPNTTCLSTDLQYDFQAEQAEANHRAYAILYNYFGNKGGTKNQREYDKYQYNEFSNKGK